MTKFERAQMIVRAKEVELQRIVGELERARQYVKDVCEHPAAQRSDYHWHHGYGKMVTGETCGLCGRKRSFKGSSAWSYDDGYNRHDDPSSAWYG